MLGASYAQVCTNGGLVLLPLALWAIFVVLASKLFWTPTAPRASVASLIAPFFALALASACLGRWQAPVEAFGSLAFSETSYKWTLLLWLTSLVTLAPVASLASGDAQRWSVELGAVLFLFPVVWGWALCATTLFALLLAVELAGLLLMLLITYSSFLAVSGAKNQRQTQAIGAVQTLVVFLWVSVVALFAMLWAFCCGYNGWTSSAFTEIRLLALFSNTALWAPHALYGVIMGLAFCLKLVLLPWQAAMAAFYKNLPAASLLFYLLAYYPWMLLLTCSVLLGTFSPAIPAFGILFGALLPLAAGSVAAWTGSTSDYRMVLALSSILNVSFLVSVVLLA